MSPTHSPDWASIRQRYEETEDPAAEICADAEIDRRDFDRIRKKQAWRRRNPRPFPPPRKSAAPGAEPALIAAAPPRLSAPPAPAATDVSAPAAPPPDSIAARRLLLDRLVAAIAMKLTQLERSMTKDLAAPDKGDASSTDHEKETRAIGAIIDNLEKITEMETGIGRNINGKRDAAATDLGHEAERCRRELAERLQRIVEAAARDP